MIGLPPELLLFCSCLQFLLSPAVVADREVSAESFDNSQS